MIENGHKRATFVAASVLTLGLMFARADACAAADKTSTAVQASIAEPASVSMVQDGLESTYLTRARTVAEYLDERGIKPASDDYLSVAKSDPIVEGMRIVYRPAISVQLVADGTKRVIRTAAATYFRVKALPWLRTMRFGPRSTNSRSLTGAFVSCAFARGPQRFTSESLRPLSGSSISISRPARRARLRPAGPASAC